MNINRAEQLYIFSGNHTYYGGDQDWFSSNTRAMGGCSSIAAANSLRALCRHNGQLRNRLLSSKSIPKQVKNALCSPRPSKNDYSIFIDGVYNCVRATEIFPLNILYDKGARGRKPFRKIRPSLGRSSIGFILGIIRFAKKFGLCIKVNAITTAFIDDQKARAFIESGLEKSGSVVMLTSHSPMDMKLYNVNSNIELLDQSPCCNTNTKNHFTTITDLSDDLILISTWGRAASASFSQVASSWKSFKAYESTLFYIEECSPTERRECMLKCMFPFIRGFIATVIRKNIER